MFKAFKYRLYPTAPQAEKINQNIGCDRFVYNHLLDDRIKVWKETKQRSKKTYCDLKKEYAFLKEADSRALLNARENLDAAYDKFFKEPSAGFPKFKSKHKCRWSYTTDNNNDTVRFDGNRLKLPKVWYVKVVEHRRHEGRILTATISHERSGEYYASVMCDIERPESLPVKGLERNHKLSKSVTDASFSKFVSMLEYKAEWYGRKIVKIDRFYPSTQLCSGCGYKNESVKGLKGLKVREWICPECGEVHDRDLNAARNILKEGLKSIEPTERGG